MNTLPAVSPEHRERYLVASAISEPVATARGYETVTDGERLVALGFKKNIVTPTLLIPLYDVLGQNGRYQHRPDVEVRVGRRVAKYLGQDGKPTILDIHPLAYEDVTTGSKDLWVTEGVRKGDAGVSRGLATVNLMSVTTWAKTDWKMIPVAGRKLYLCFDSDVMTKQDVRRQLQQLGTWLEGRDAEVWYVYLPPTATGGKVGLDDFFAAGGTVEQLYSYASPTMRDGEVLPAWMCDDIGNAERFVYYLGEAARFVPKVGWHLWNGVYWKVDEAGRVVSLAKDVVRKIYHEAAEVADQERQKVLADHARKSGKLGPIKAMLELAEPEVVWETGALNPNPLLINFINGTYDLATARLSPHDPEDAITHCAPVDYNPKARCKEWNDFLGMAFPKEEIRAFVQRFIGMSFIGDNREERMAIAVGKQGAGKGTFSDAISAAFGLDQYVRVVNYDSFLQRLAPGGPRSDLASLNTCRVVFTSEFPDNKRVDTELIKSMTGGDAITVRHLYNKEFTFRPKFTVWMFAEHEPDVPPDNGGYWRRAIKIPFQADNDPEKLDPTIKAKLKNPDYAGEAVAAWVIQGALDYLSHGLQIPEVITTATKEYRATQNPVTPFIAERCDLAPALSIKNSTLKTAYNQWQAQAVSDRVPLSDRRFSQLVGAVAGVRGVDRNFGKLWEGIDLKPGKSDTSDTSEGNSETPYKKSPLHGEFHETTLNVSLVSLPTDFAPPITNAEEARRLLTSLPPSVPLDIETTDLSPRVGQARLLTVHDGQRAHIIDLFKTGPIPVMQWLGAREVIGHNLQFEFGFLPPTKETKAWDTMLATQVLDAGLFTQKGHYGLASVAERFTGQSLDKAEQLSDWQGDLTTEQLAYAARDVTYLHAIKEKQAQQLADAGLMETANLEMRALMGISWMARTGVPFDLDAWLALAAENAEKQRTVLDELNLFAPINWSSPKQVGAFFAAAGHPLSGTAEAVLAGVNHPAAQLLLTYRGLAKQTGTYGENWSGYVHDGRIYAGWKQAFTATGRMSCAEPNLQNLPRDPRVRACFRAGDGNVLVSADYAQIEARAAAVISGDPKLLDVFNSGKDVYSTVANQLTGRRDIAKADPERQMAKSAVLGLMYGMGNERFVSYCRSSTPPITEEMADDADLQIIRDKFFKTYARLRQWQREQGADDVTETRSLMGRRRLDQKFYSERLNHPVQATAADGMKAALARLWEESSGKNYDASPVLCVHDSLTLECREEQQNGVADWLRTVMVEEMDKMIGGVPIKVDVTVGKEWA